MIQLCFYKRITIGHSNERAATAENESQYNIQWISKLLLFFFEVYFGGGAPKIYTNQLKDICNGVHFFDKIEGWGSANLPKNTYLQVFSIICAQICSFL